MNAYNNPYWVTDAQVAFCSILSIMLWTPTGIYGAFHRLRCSAGPLDSFSIEHLDRTGSARRTNQRSTIKDLLEMVRMNTYIKTIIKIIIWNIIK